ncbi:MAG: hypothetical protein JO363_04670 [Solirubrobacterales bacterium]|nr:hypothetical protein [Solirubrobacterales bacterium]
MSGLRGDHDPGATGGDDVAELLQNERGAVQVDLEDRRWRPTPTRRAIAWPIKPGPTTTITLLIVNPPVGSS